jgi:deazaflavin-dependent oxidoreductase (nitroreductase family)
MAEQAEFYRRPSWPVRMLNNFLTWLAAFGVGPSRLVALEVKGRKSGEPRTTTVNMAEHGDHEYLVSPRGNTDWVRNVRAAGGEAVIRHGRRRAVRLHEVPEEERAPIIQTYLKKNTLSTRQHFGLKPDAPIEEFQRIAPRHPVFRVEYTE